MKKGLAMEHDISGMGEQASVQPSDAGGDPHADPPARAWGKLFVTRRCCGAGTCRNYAPELFGEVIPRAVELRAGALPVLADSHEAGAFTGVLRQPQSKEDDAAARAAAAGCAFNAIRYKKVTRSAPREAPSSPWLGWPQRIEDNVWAVGRPATKNFGALAYFVELPGGGLLVDVPKPSEDLFRWLEVHGGVRWLFITHRDHAQHHAEFAARFPGCVRILGARDVNTRANTHSDRTDDVELKLPDVLAPLTLEGAPLTAANADFVVLPQPGHTPGSACLLYSGRCLFTGDHLRFSRAFGHIVASRLVCWQDWQTQTQSVEALVSWTETYGLRFEWLLPGHGEWHRFAGGGSPQQTTAELRSAVAWMRAQPPGHMPLARWVLFVLSRTNPRVSWAVRALFGEHREAKVLPRAVRKYVPES